ncbi:MAG: DUF503 domain-containing protein [Limnochordaceae bacterium]|nr:DUF503 domain-containing protein [Limnochordaceae bacterium]
MASMPEPSSFSAPVPLAPATSRSSPPVPHDGLTQPKVMVAVLSLWIPQAQSLKDRRSVVQMVVGRIRSRFGVAVAEVGSQEQYCRAELAVATVSREAFLARQAVDEVVRFVDRVLESDGRAQLVEIGVDER